MKSVHIPNYELALRVAASHRAKCEVNNRQPHRRPVSIGATAGSTTVKYTSQSLWTSYWLHVTAPCRTRAHLAEMSLPPRYDVSRVCNIPFDLSHFNLLGTNKASAAVYLAGAVVSIVYSGYLVGCRS